jgi:hypothetical protein
MSRFFVLGDRRLVRRYRYTFKEVDRQQGYQLDQ